MQSYDIKTERKALYAPKPGDFEIIDVPEMSFLMIDGHGDPNTSAAYRHAVETLYKASYAVRAAAKAGLGRVHTVAPLEGLWSADDLEVFRTRDKSAWDWTMMIAQPIWVIPELVGAALVAARNKQLPALDLLRFERYAEGPSVQILHVGSYDDEGPHTRSSPRRVPARQRAHSHRAPPRDLPFRSPKDRTRQVEDHPATASHHGVVIARRFFYDETCKWGPEEVDARQSAEGVRHDRRRQRRAAITSYLVGLDWLCPRRPRSFRSSDRVGRSDFR